MSKSKPRKTAAKAAKKVVKKPSVKGKTKADALLTHLRKIAGSKPIPDYLKIDEDF